MAAPNGTDAEVRSRRSLCGDTANQLLTADEVGRCLGVTERWVYSEARAGRIPHVRLGRYVRFHPDAVNEWLAAIEQAA